MRKNPNRRIHRHLFTLALLCSLWTVAGCGTKDKGQEDDTATPEELKVHRVNVSTTAGDATSQKEVDPILPGSSTGGETDFPDISVPPDKRETVKVLVEDLLDFMESKFSKDIIFARRYRETFDRKIRDSKHFISLMREIYSQEQYRPLFFQFDERRIPILTEEGKQLRDIVGAADSHGLDPSLYRLKQLQDAFVRLSNATADYEEARESLRDGRARQLWTMIENRKKLPEEDVLAAMLVEAGFDNEDAPLVADLARFYPNLIESKKKLNEVVQEIDIALLHGFFQFVLDFKYIYRAHPFHPTPEVSLAHARFTDELRTDYQAAHPKFSSYMLGLIPQNPTYEALRKGLVRYRALRDAGQIEKFQVKHNLKRGSRGDRVKILTQRLAAEGFLPEQYVGERYDAHVEDAVQLYQTTHQLRRSGRVDSSTRRSMNVSMRRRVEQIELALQRWRESPVTRDKLTTYLRVNLPQFEVELWEDNKLTRKHRIVIGNTNEEISLVRKQRGYFNHTPLLQKELKTIVLNPLWYPTPRIQKELLSNLEQEPDYFEKHNYGIKMSSDGSEVIFQKSGPENALGLVKFLFPNEHKVYMHDTNAKALFDRPIRSYSHGCMRMDKPLEMARYLLKKINGLTDKDIDKILEKGEEYYIKLKETIPVIIDYCSIGVDSEGRMEFYIDIYKYDRAYWDKQLPVALTEELTDSEIERLSGEGSSGSAGEGEDGVFPGE